MGARAQVRVMDESNDVYLYTHWGAESLERDVRKALKRSGPDTAQWGSRWNDSEYLARIIFDDMKDGDSVSLTGFGISNFVHGDIECLITVDCGNQKVIVDRTMYGGESMKYTFEQFLVQE